jgi:hypothetical protein
MQLRNFFTDTGLKAGVNEKRAAPDARGALAATTLYTS